MLDVSSIKITRSRRMSISLTVLRDGTVTVKAPILIPMKFITDFIKSKSEWIEKKQNIISRNVKTPKKFENGEIFIYLGNPYTLQLGNFTDIAIKEDKLLFPTILAKQGRTVMEKWYIKQAKGMINQQVAYYAEKMNTSYASISFSDTRSKWGSCTHDNRLQFNWRLIMTPLLVVRYVVIHELAHTTEKNHSTIFWNKVRAINPSYKMQIKWLKLNGHGLIV